MSDAARKKITEPVPLNVVEASFGGRAWSLRPVDEGMALALGQRFDLPEMVGRILVARGFGPEEAPGFLEPRLKDFLPDPSHLLGLDAAVDRLVQAIEDEEPIGIIADYDVDGATSCALLTRHLRALGASVAFDVPDRLDEGYGPNRKAFARLESRAVSSWWSWMPARPPSSLSKRRRPTAMR